MLAKVIIENGVKKIQALTADTGTGAPVGTIIPMYKKSSPSGYLYCDGSTFDETAYPLLYAYLGTNVLPDYREFALVGAEQNTTDTIASHDVYVQGEGKDDQLQDHQHKIVLSPAQSGSGQQLADQGLTGNYSTGTVSSSARSGTVTRGKRKAVYFYIKATSGLSENTQDNVINTLNEQRSYSTEEHPTGKKWIDGKPIYRKVFNLTAPSDSDTNATIGEIPSTVDKITFTYAYVDMANIAPQNAIYPAPSPKMTGNENEYFCYWLSFDNFNIRARVGSDFISKPVLMIIEYTKTTD